MRFTTQVAFARRDPVEVRLDAKAFTKVARYRAHSHTARMYSVFLVTRNATGFLARISIPTRYSHILEGARLATHVNKCRTPVLVSDVTGNFGTVVQAASLSRQGARFTAQMSVDHTNMLARMSRT
jgi:hypothetical protein